MMSYFHVAHSRLIAWIGLYMSVWFFSNYEHWRSVGFCPRALEVATGVAGYACFSLSLLLSSRWKRLEDWLGGLDRIYHDHRFFGIWGFCFILIHPLISALRLLPQHPGLFFMFTLPFHRHLSINLGAIAYWMMLVILAATFLKLLPYRQWKIMHRFMSVVFILATLHFLLLKQQFGTDFSEMLLYVPMLVGLFGIFYKQIYLELFASKARLKVLSLKNAAEGIVEMTLEPQDSIQYMAGQYGFFIFEAEDLSRESHPFTMIGQSGKTSIELLVKVRGDFTEALQKQLHPGCKVLFEGPYGRLFFLRGGCSQLWISGGIGMVPFLAWIREMDPVRDKDKRIDYYYCVHHKKDAVFFDEFRRLSESFPNFRCFLFCTEEGKRLDLENIMKTGGEPRHSTIFMCGPKKLTRHFNREFRNLGIKQEQIIYEDFEFF